MQGAQQKGGHKGLEVVGWCEGARGYRWCWDTQHGSFQSMTFVVKCGEWASKHQPDIPVCNSIRAYVNPTIPKPAPRTDSPIAVNDASLHSLPQIKPESTLPVPHYIWAISKYYPFAPTSPTLIQVTMITDLNRLNHLPTGVPASLFTHIQPIPCTLDAHL